MLVGAKKIKTGESFGNYIIKGFIGVGGMGVVYLVQHKILDTYHALKILTAESLGHDQVNVERFIREAKFTYRLKHPNLIDVYDVGYDESTDSYYIIMDYMPGGSLHDLLRKVGRVPLANALQIVTQMAQALCVAYDHEIVHRDIKPDNILFTATGDAKLADLGVAKFTGSHLITVTMGGAGPVGTPTYIPIEQLRDSRTVDSRADIYSLGVVFYEMLTGIKPYGEGAMYEVLSRVMEGGPFPDILTYCPDLPEAVVALVRDMTARNREDRIATPHDLLVRLSQIHLTERPQMLPIRVTNTHLKITSAQDNFGGKGNKTSFPHLIRRMRKKWLAFVLWACGGLLALGLAGGLFAFLATPTVVREQDLPASVSIPLAPSVILDLVKVPHGTFKMGTPDHIATRDSDEHYHTVTITKDFYIGKYEVTQAQYEAVMGYNPSRHEKGGNYPVERVEWQEARVFCKHLNRQFRDKIPAGFQFDLPTEAEWEYAARGCGNEFRCAYAGSEDVNAVAWYAGNTRQTNPVGAKAPNELGLYDMSGNVSEWCRDWFAADYYQENQVDPSGPLQGAWHVIRGGAWYHAANNQRVADRYYATPKSAPTIGFRVVLRRVD